MISDKILYIFKWIAGVIAGTTAIIGIITLIYTQGVRAAESKYRSNSIEVKVDRLICLDSIKNEKIDQVLINQDQFTYKQIIIEKKLDDLNRSYVNHLKTDKKVDELIEYLEGTKEEELKKKDQSYVIVPIKTDRLIALGLKLK